MVMLHGCQVDDDTLIGIGSTILNKTKIGKNCIIGANTLIPENKTIPDRSLVLGSPGKVIRQVTEKEIEEIKENAKHYVENYKRYKKNI
jgi:carbonic anhydrase/acetyltransferase-like protein (isoleucine patch superfamily)